jgi:predicted lactoylglutathione lyase
VCVQLFAQTEAAVFTVPVVYPITLSPYKTMSKPRKLFVNLRVHDLNKSKAFFSALGFTFNPQFTDDNAACMIVSDDGYFMLLTEKFFDGFTTKKASDTTQFTEGLYALSCESRAEVDELVKKALAAGGSPAMPPQDHGFMYGWSFYDPDGHHFEVMWMDPATIQ